MALVLNGSGTIQSDDITLSGNANVTGAFAVTGDMGIATADLPTGSILQVVSVTKTSRFTTTSTSFTDVTGFSATITPSSASSKILVIASTTGACNSSTGPVFINLTRAGSSVYIGDAVNSAVRCSSYLTSASNDKAQAMSINYLDSPATTSAVTYQVQIRSESGSIVSVGGSTNTSVANVSGATPSTILLLEVAG